MTVNELFVAVLTLVVELVERVVLAFSRTFILVTEGRLGALVLLDLGIIAVTLVIGSLIIGSVVMRDRATVTDGEDE